MSFSDYLNKSWNDHATAAVAVAEGFPGGIRLLEKNDQIPALANLITHVTGEHLGEWAAGVSLLKQLRLTPVYNSSDESGRETEKAIQRSIASLELAGNLRGSLEEFSLSDQIRILAVAASALSEKNPVRAQELFREALAKAESGISKKDPANRALAVTGNNLACALEEKPSRSEAETKLMILAAQTGRKFWEIAGTWLETERSEYRLSQTYLKAGDTQLAYQHAKSCIDICKQNAALPLEFFFGYEALAQVEKAKGAAAQFNEAVAAAEKYFNQLTDDNKSWCEASLKKLK